MLVLSSTDAQSDAALFAERGIGDFAPFSFERKATRPDGSETRVAFTLAFASDPAAPKVGFLVCQQHLPQNFWNREFQQHPNSAAYIAAVALATPHPQLHADFLGRFSGAEQERLPDSSWRFELDDGRIEVVSAAQVQTQFVPSPSFESVSVGVGAMEVLTQLLSEEGVPFTSSNEGVVISPALLFGVELRFEKKRKN